jgi:lipopolysaccharide/colanic/teichoic acid biosynthesis glycosyltransferase
MRVEAGASKRPAAGGERPGPLCRLAELVLEARNVLLQRRPVVTAPEIVKRGFDLVVSTVGLILCLPLLALVALLVRLDSPGPVIFRQKRIGRHGEPFFVYKFRTMQYRPRLDDEPECTTPIVKGRPDPRVTRIGRFLRKYSVDELPQLVNVIKGQMSLVGPRPFVWGEVDLSDLRVRRRHEAMPGLTCIWQVSGRSKLDLEQRLQLDLQYVEEQSFWMDLVLLWKTIGAVIRAEGAY